MNSNYGQIYEGLLKAGETYKLALEAACKCASEMAKSLELNFPPLDELERFTSQEAAMKFSGVAYEYVLAELVQRKAISPEIRFLLKHKAYDPGNPPPTAENLADFAEYAKKMEDKTKWKHAQTAKP